MRRALSSKMYCFITTKIWGAGVFDAVDVNLLINDKLSITAINTIWIVTENFFGILRVACIRSVTTCMAVL